MTVRAQCKHGWRDREQWWLDKRSGRDDVCDTTVAPLPTPSRGVLRHDVGHFAT